MVDVGASSLSSPGSGVGIGATVENPLSKIKDFVSKPSGVGSVARPGIGGGVIDVSPYIQGFPGFREGIESTVGAIEGLFDEAKRMSRGAVEAAREFLDSSHPFVQQQRSVSPQKLTQDVPAPFTGGQSVGVRYRVEFEYYNAGRRFFAQVVLTGKITRMGIVPSTYPGYADMLIFDHAQGQLLYTLGARPGELYGFRVTGMRREDYQPDTGGNPPPVSLGMVANSAGLLGSASSLGLSPNSVIGSGTTIGYPGALGEGDDIYAPGIYAPGSIGGAGSLGLNPPGNVSGAGVSAPGFAQVFDGFGTDIFDPPDDGIWDKSFVPGAGALAPRDGKLADSVKDSIPEIVVSNPDGFKPGGDPKNQRDPEPKMVGSPLPPCVTIGVGCKSECSGDDPLLEGEFRAKRTCDTSEEEMAIIPWGGNGWYGLQNAFKALDLKLAYLEQLICNQECISAIPVWWEELKTGDCPQYELLMRSREKIGLKYEYRYFYIPNPIPDPDDKKYPTWVAGNINVRGYYPDGRSISVYVDSESEGEMVISYLHTKTSYSSLPDITIVKTNRQVSQIEYVPYLVRYKTPENKFGEYVFETRIIPKGEPSPNVYNS